MLGQGTRPAQRHSPSHGPHCGTCPGKAKLGALWGGSGAVLSMGWLRELPPCQGGLLGLHQGCCRHRPLVTHTALWHHAGDAGMGTVPTPKQCPEQLQQAPRPLLPLTQTWPWL